MTFPASTPLLCMFSSDFLRLFIQNKYFFLILCCKFFISLSYFVCSFFRVFYFFGERMGGGARIEQTKSSHSLEPHFIHLSLLFGGWFHYITQLLYSNLNKEEDRHQYLSGSNSCLAIAATTKGTQPEYGVTAFRAKKNHFPKSQNCLVLYQSIIILRNAVLVFLQLGNACFSYVYVVFFAIHLLHSTKFLRQRLNGKNN